jgi:hypothetical protein
MDVGGRPVLLGPSPVAGSRQVLRGSRDDMRGQPCGTVYGRSWPVGDRGPTAAYKARAEIARGPDRKSERPMVPLGSAGQHNPRRGTGPYFHHASYGAPPGGLP